MRRIAAVLLFMFVVGTIAGVACWPDTAAQEAVTPPGALPFPDINAAIILVRNFSGDTVPLFIVAQNHAYMPLGAILPQSSGIWVLPSNGLMGLETLAVFFVLEGQVQPGAMMDRERDHVSLLQFVIGEPGKEI